MQITRILFVITAVHGNPKPEACPNSANRGVRQFAGRQFINDAELASDLPSFDGKFPFVC